jgi:alginate O-acetyltransferase complex protein AlgI
VALCLGFSVPDNFHFPYAAVGFSDFWRRWHISLSTWMRDYVYIPLGGSRQGRLRTCLNLMLTMLIGGLWHGASWTFVFWGGLHGVFLMIEGVFRQWVAPSSRWTSAIVRPFQALATFALVCFAWVFFRAGSFGRSFTIASAMLGRVGSEAQRSLAQLDVVFVLATMVPMLSLHWLMRDKTLEAVADKCPWWFRAVLLALMLMAIATKTGDTRAFIYFQF